MDYFEVSPQEQKWIDYDSKCAEANEEDTINFQTRCNSSWN